MSEKRSLTPAQIQYMRIGPKVCNSVTATKQLQHNINQFNVDISEGGPSLSNIPRFTFGNFEKTVSNFGVLLQRNFQGLSTLHQAQKFGNIAIVVDKDMQEEKDRSSEGSKNSHKRTFSDTRTALKAIYEYKGHKLLLTMKSFSIELIQTHRIVETLPVLFLKQLTAHVPSNKLLKTIEYAMKQEGSTITIDYEQIDGKVAHSPNNETRYSEGSYQFEKAGQQFVINLPTLEIYHSESEYKQTESMDNKDILDVIEADFDNVETIFLKYFNMKSFQQAVGRTGLDHHSLPPQD